MEASVTSNKTYFGITSYFSSVWIPYIEPSQGENARVRSPKTCFRPRKTFGSSMHVVPQDRAGGADLKEGADVSLPKAIEVNNYKKTQTLEERRCILQTCPEKQCSCRIRPPHFSSSKPCQIRQKCHYSEAQLVTISLLSLP